MAMIHYTTHEHLQAHEEEKHSAWIWGQGIAAGFLAWIVFTAIQIVAAWIIAGDPLLPLRMSASVLYTVPPELISTTAAVFAGGIFSIVYSMLVGVVVAYLVERSRALHRTRGSIIIFSALISLALWIINFYIIAPVIGAEWFTTDTNPILQFLFHTFAFGAILGWYLDANPPIDSMDGSSIDIEI